MFSKKVIFVASMSLCSAQVAYAETLKEVVQESFFTNPVILQSEQNLEYAKGTAGKAFSSYLPEVTASSTLTNKRSTTSTSTTSSQPKVYKLSVTQDLFKGWGNVSENRSATMGVKEAEARVNLVKQQQALLCATAYMDVLQQEEESKLQQNLVDVLTEQKKATESRFEAGEVTKTDVQQANARLAEAKAAAIKAASKVTQAKEALKVFLGRMPSKVKWPEMPEGEIDVTQDVIDNVLSNHPDVLASLMDLSQKKHDITKEKSAYYPSVTASAELARNENLSSGAADYTDRSISLNLSMDLFTGGATQSAVSQAKAMKMEAQHYYEETKRRVKEELINAQQSMLESKAVLSAFQESMAAEKRATEGVRLEASLGERSVLDVLDAEQAYLESQVNVTQARRDVIISHYRLQAALGKLTALFE